MSKKTKRTNRSKATRSPVKSATPILAEKVVAESRKLAERSQQIAEDAHVLHARADAVHQREDEAHRSARRRRNPRKADAAFPIVGIGASAGGLEALTQFLKELPADNGMAIVVVQHLDPTHDSALASLLGRITSMPVLEAANKVLVEPNHIYVITPNRCIEISGLRLKIFPRDDKSPRDQLPIDRFLKSLAEEAGSHSMGIILSGNGADGTQGMLAIKAAGGITFAQEEKTAKYPAMPGNAIAAGCVDFVLAPDKLAEQLTHIAAQLSAGKRSLDGESSDAPPGEEKAFNDILLLLRQRTGVDFTLYKHATLRRRIHRRQMLQRVETMQQYATLLRSNAEEASDLFDDILIHVTGFFRDKQVFKTLRQKLFPRLLKNKSQDEALRIWIAGCSTGEEVYSIAILLTELFTELKVHHPVQIFGTDVNENALAKARAGLYPECIHTDLSADQLRRFFSKTEGGYRVNKTIREMCIFARQNLVNDPPFSNLDFISCRNVLIYLGPPLQRKVLPVFHYALRTGGLLMLGSSETIGSFAELFALQDKKAKVYAKRATQIRPTVSFTQATQQVPQADKEYLPPPPPVDPSVQDIQKHADRIVLTSYSLAGVVINRDLEVIQFRGKTGLFLEHTHGEATLNLLKMAREGLMPELRAGIAKAIKQNIRVRHEGLRVKPNGHVLECCFEVVPFSIPLSRERYYLVLFEPTGMSRTDKERQDRRGKPLSRKAAESAELAHLRQELGATRESLQTIIEEQEATNEELRSANEEIMSSNEELQSTNEELETAKEELQSTNEELTTLNDELEGRNVELEVVNNDLHNLLASVNIPVLILGADLRIRRYTQGAEKMFKFLPGDVGRPITDINLPLDIKSLDKVVLEVFDTLTPKEFEARDQQGRWWSVRIRPYKTTDHKIDGAVIALLDVESLKAQQERITYDRSFAEAIVNTVRQPLLVLDKDLKVVSANNPFLKTFRVSAQDTLNRLVYRLGNGQWDIPKLRTFLEEILPQKTSFSDFEVEHTFPYIGKKRMLLSARRLIFDDGASPMILLAIEPEAY